MKRISILLLAVALIQGCSRPEPGFNHSISNTDIESMKDMSEILKSESINHKYKTIAIILMGEISYKDEDKERVQEIYSLIERSTWSKYEEPHRGCYLKALTELNLKYLVKEKSSQTWIRMLIPENSREELNNRAVSCIGSSYANAL